ncbi:MAG: PhnD/SsuA/transferrin family substrate-binding protein [Phototrophicaceae bacterium]
MTIQWHRFLLFSIVFIVAACGSLEELPPPRPPTITPTPISTPLPYVATAIPAGFNTDNPIQIVIVPADPVIAAERLEEFETTLQSLTDVTIRVVLAETQSEAFDAVCASQSGIVSAAWLDGMSFIANDFANCGVGVLQADTPDGTGTTGVLLLNREFEEDGLESALESPLCRLGVDDLYSWTLPVLFYGAEGIELGDILEIDEGRDNDDIIDDIEAGRCAVIGMEENAWEAYLDADEDGSLAEAVTLIATSPEIPYNIFSFSVSLSIDAIADIEAGLRQMDIAAGRSEPDAEATVEPSSASVDVDSDLMTAFFGEGSLISVTDADFADLFNFFNASGIAFSELNN